MRRPGQLEAPHQPFEHGGLLAHGAGGGGAFFHQRGVLLRHLVELRHRGADLADAVEVLLASPDRVSAPCRYAGRCGGCDFQHVSLSAQRRLKAEVVGEQFARLARRAVDVIARNIETVGLPGATVRRGSVASVLAAGPPSPADLVLADPPYEVGNAEVETILAALASHGWLAPDAVAVIERAANSPPLNWPSGWEVWPQRRYGDTRLEAGVRIPAAC